MVTRSAGAPAGGLARTPVTPSTAGDAKGQRQDSRDTHDSIASSWSRQGKGSRAARAATLRWCRRPHPHESPQRSDRGHYASC